jgi:hypothetical protein
MVVTIIIITCVLTVVGVGFYAMSINQNKLILELSDKLLTSKKLEIKSLKQKESLQLRLQALERLTILLERIHPDALLQRLADSDQSSEILHFSLLVTIKAEFEHNLSQQIYVDATTWISIINAKNTLIAGINQLFQSIGTGSNSMELSKLIIGNQVANNEIAYSLSLLRNEALSLME